MLLLNQFLEKDQGMIDSLEGNTKGRFAPLAYNIEESKSKSKNYFCNHFNIFVIIYSKSTTYIKSRYKMYFL